MRDVLGVSDDQDGWFNGDLAALVVSGTEKVGELTTCLVEWHRTGWTERSMIGCRRTRLSTTGQRHP
jgi:hypothetical protein